MVRNSLVVRKANLQIVSAILPENKWTIKCPYTLNPRYITIHETANDASAENEISYMQGNFQQVSFHFAVDDKQVIQGLPLDRNAWHAGDGNNGTGNRESVSIEICYSKSGGVKYELARENAIELAAQLLQGYGLSILSLKTHQDWSGKSCPHRMLTENRWSDFVNQVNFKMTDGYIHQLEDGYQSILWQGQCIHIYCRKENQEIGLLSSDVATTIDKMDNDEIHYCKVNCSYFVLEGPQEGTVCGRQQGFNCDDRPDQAQWLDTVITKEGKIISQDLQSWEYPKENVKIGYSPAVVLLKEGMEVTEISSAVNDSKYQKANHQTLHMQNQEGKDVFAVVEGFLNGQSCREFAKRYRMSYCAMLDGGTSSQMIVEGKKVLYTGRKIVNALTFYTKKIQEEYYKVQYVLLVKKIGLYLRKELIFNQGKNNSEILHFIPIGNEAIILSFIPAIQSDGYQWLEVLYQQTQGYCQLDSKTYTIEERRTV